MTQDVVITHSYKKPGAGRNYKLNFKFDNDSDFRKNVEETLQNLQTRIKNQGYTMKEVKWLLGRKFLIEPIRSTRKKEVKIKHVYASNASNLNSNDSSYESIRTPKEIAMITVSQKFRISPHKRNNKVKHPRSTSPKKRPRSRSPSQKSN